MSRKIVWEDSEHTMDVIWEYSKPSVGKKWYELRLGGGYETLRGLPSLEEALRVRELYYDTWGDPEAEKAFWITMHSKYPSGITLREGPGIYHLDSKTLGTPIEVDPSEYYYVRSGSEYLKPVILAHEIEHARRHSKGLDPHDEEAAWGKVSKDLERTGSLTPATKRFIKEMLKSQEEEKEEAKEE